MLSTRSSRSTCTSGAAHASATARSTPRACFCITATVRSPRTPEGELTVDLGLLELAAVVDVHRLPLGERVDHGRTAFAMAVPGLLHAAERKLHLGTDRRTVDVRDARLDVADRAHGAIHVGRVDRGAEAVGRVVEHLD